MNNIYSVIEPALLEKLERQLMVFEQDDWEYKKHAESYNSSFEELKKIMPEEAMKRLYRLEEAKNAMEAIELREIYHKGMEDTLALLKMLQVI